MTLHLSFIAIFPRHVTTSVFFMLHNNRRNIHLPHPSTLAKQVQYVFFNVKKRPRIEAIIFIKKILSEIQHGSMQHLKFWIQNVRT